jgi:hypothetical protein
LNRRRCYRLGSEEGLADCAADFVEANLELVDELVQAALDGLTASAEIVPPTGD